MDLYFIFVAALLIYAGVVLVARYRLRPEFRRRVLLGLAFIAVGFVVLLAISLIPHRSTSHP